jgi:hypothetical protein
MALLQIAEVFGHGVEDVSESARAIRLAKNCPFRNMPCTKSSKRDPIGVCTLSDGINSTALCPVRLIEGNRVFVDAARLAFGPRVRFAPVPEVSILRVRNSRKIGKIDYLLARLDGNGVVSDFAALEVQAVYFSGGNIRTPMKAYLRTGALGSDSRRRPDYRSSAQKRLMPQLSLKVPVFRRWGKKFFVAVDSLFFEALPEFKRVDTPANSEITWLAYPFTKIDTSYHIGDPIVAYSLWDDVATALREGTAPEPAEIVAQLQRSLKTDRILET